MPTTSNFGWTTPADTDLVNQGAAAIRTLGNGIDTSLVDLKGGTTNQVLAKNSNTDLDFKWVADASGIPATIFDAKGDIIAATAADTADRLAVGANGTVLTADSTTATGLKWAAPAASGFVGCKLTKSVGQNCNNNTDTTITWDQEEFDTDGFHSNSVNNSRVTIPSGKGGKYLFVVAMSFEANTSGRRESRLFKNGNGTNTFFFQNAATSGKNLWISTNILDLAVNDYVELQVMQTSGTNLDFMVESYFSMVYLGA